ncbi:hypothetical protein SAICODRAFT_172780 [Saitoella complicata NRRL Y-17804]|uniref:uncharacterized protein n=1 Tax=Saitoella complicata (strain BCRC 22490 / CBS 7301 / JCM 7358 / NBRC 10748 / NRRL Y-17804) TaxID=698492 RepID=UPI000867105C|nr:uncharacterized protein SAICODRAFT_172780 [Saitoella complicata NRRL Y-17804]ODQ50408.1 hypothetical protein SAICODRAFT_172780 [Saitoella complicata NRRL Y-17804]
MGKTSSLNATFVTTRLTTLVTIRSSRNGWELTWWVWVWMPLRLKIVSSTSLLSSQRLMRMKTRLVQVTPSIKPLLNNVSRSVLDRLNSRQSLELDPRSRLSVASLRQGLQ